MTEQSNLHICDLCKAEFVNKQKLSVHRKGRGIRCASRQEVANSVISQSTKRASSPDAATPTKSQRPRLSESPDLDVVEINVMDIIPEVPGLEYRIINDDESEQEISSGLSHYRTFQENLYNSVFTFDCLNCKDLDEFVGLLKISAESQSRRGREDKAMTLYAAMKSIPRAMGDELLSVLSLLGCEKLFKKWETLKRHLYKSMKGLNRHKEYYFNWPENWKITELDWKGGNPPACMKILVNDPLQQIALLLVDPHFMFFFKDQIKLVAKLDETTPRKISDFMSTQLASDTQQLLWNNRGYQNNKVYADYERDIVIALKLYEDGVSMGWGGATSTIAVMGAILNCDIDLQRRDVSKFVIGYIDNLTSVSEEVIIAHLTSVVGMSLTTAKEELRFFHRKLENFFKEKYMEFIKAGWNNSYEMHILGYGLKKVLLFVLKSCSHTRQPILVSMYF